MSGFPVRFCLSLLLYQVLFLWTYKQVNVAGREGGGGGFSLIEAYNSVFHYDIISLSETNLNESINDKDVRIEGYSREVFRCDYPNGKKVGVCLYFKENLAIKRRKDLEITQETVICEISVRRKKVQIIHKLLFLLIHFIEDYKKLLTLPGLQTALCHSKRRPELSF